MSVLRSQYRVLLIAALEVSAIAFQRMGVDHALLPCSALCAGNYRISGHVGPGASNVSGRGAVIAGYLSWGIS
jgi:hypothetical protein